MPASEEQWAAASLLNVVSVALFWANNLFLNLPLPNETSTPIYLHFYRTMREIHHIILTHPEYLPAMNGILQLVPLPNATQHHHQVNYPQDLMPSPAPQPPPRHPRDGAVPAPEEQVVPAEQHIPAPQPPPLPARVERRRNPVAAKASKRSK